MRVASRGALCLMLTLAWCLAPTGGAEGSDEGARTGQARTAEDLEVQRFEISAPSSTQQDADGAVALALLRKSREPGDALILGAMTDRVGRKLQYAFPLALERVREVDACRELFTQFGADGVETLISTVYRPAASERELEICSTTGALAFTTIGRSNTSLCDRFGGYSRQAAAMILIHEALHAAGMSEQPRDPDALSSFQINRLVRRSCDL